MLEITWNVKKTWNIENKILKILFFSIFKKFIKSKQHSINISYSYSAKTKRDGQTDRWTGGCCYISRPGECEKCAFWLFGWLPHTHSYADTITIDYINALLHSVEYTVVEGLICTGASGDRYQERQTKQMCCCVTIVITGLLLSGKK